MTRRCLIKMMVAFGTMLAIPMPGKENSVVRILQNRCVGCRDCYRVCPVDCIKFVRGKAVVDTGVCNGCMLCPAVCSYGAIEKCEKSN